MRAGLFALIAYTSTTTLPALVNWRLAGIKTGTASGAGEFCTIYWQHGRAGCAVIVLKHHPGLILLFLQPLSG